MPSLRQGFLIRKGNEILSVRIGAVNTQGIPQSLRGSLSHHKKNWGISAHPFESSLLWLTRNGSPFRVALAARSICSGRHAQPRFSARPANRTPTNIAGASANYPPRDSHSPGDQPSLPSAAPPYKPSSGSPPPVLQSTQPPSPSSPSPSLPSPITPLPTESATPRSASISATSLSTRTSGSPPPQSNPPPEAVILSQTTVVSAPPTQVNALSSASLPSNSPPPVKPGLASSPAPKANPPPKTTVSTASPLPKVPPPGASVSSSPPIKSTMPPLSQSPPLRANPPSLLSSPLPKVAPPQSPVPSSPSPTASKNLPPPRNPPPTSDPRLPKVGSLAVSQTPPVKGSPPPKGSPPQSTVASSSPPPQVKSPPPLRNPPPTKAAISLPPATKANPPPQTKNSPPPTKTSPGSAPPPIKPNPPIQTYNKPPPKSPPPPGAPPPPKAKLSPPPPPKKNPPPPTRRPPPPKSPVPPPPRSKANPPPPRRAPPPPPVRQCRSTSDCPTNKGCCTEESTGKVGVCTNVPVLSNGTQVCYSCNYFNGPTCPPEFGVCCSDGECRASANECTCFYTSSDCPTGHCCNHDYFTSSSGFCTDMPVLSNGTQVCFDCHDFNGLVCPDNKAFCCPDGKCAANESACTCQSSDSCPAGYCCTGSNGVDECGASESGCKCEACTCDYLSECPTGFCCTEASPGQTGRCTNAPINSSGKQVCPNCNYWNGLSCPAGKGTCCANSGQCVASPTSCPCEGSYDCPSNTCCSTEYESDNLNYKQGTCYKRAVLANGTQICPNCNLFNGLSCPASKPTCCPASGECAANESACTCESSYSCPDGFCCTGSNGVDECAAGGSGCKCGRCPCQYSSQCPTGFCCTEEGSGQTGKCTDAPIDSGGTQVCLDCNDWDGLSCPAGKGTCCATGQCVASGASCPCFGSDNCPDNTCCSREYEYDYDDYEYYRPKQGTCYGSPFLGNGTQICPDCNNLNGLSCPAGKGTCCRTGECVASGITCPCRGASDCPVNTCCSSNSEYDPDTGDLKRGTCYNTPILANGTQICPECNRLNGLSCPASKPTCCASGDCAANESECPCLSSYSCPDGFCCYRSNGIDECAANESGCKCKVCTCTYSGQCPIGYCCTEENSGQTGKCTNAPIDSGGTQVCPDCNDDWNGLSCPASKGTCCETGQCVGSEASCLPCRGSYDCPDNNCCSREYEYDYDTGSYAQGTCYTTPVLANGTQVCPNCNYWSGVDCPAGKETCCATGQCVALGTTCPCRGASDCPENTCCSREYEYDFGGYKQGTCYNTPVLANGTQICADCNFLNGLSCPASKPTCCPLGECAANESACTCQSSDTCPSVDLCCIGSNGVDECAANESGCKCGTCPCENSSQCLFGFCCTEEDSGETGRCTNAPINGSGMQVCPDCNYWNGLSCPASKGTCCLSGQCVAPDSCPCTDGWDCAYNTCCSREIEYDNTGNLKQGTCYDTPVLANGTQVCPDCNYFDFYGVSCPDSKSTCCPSGRRVASSRRGPRRTGWIAVSEWQPSRCAYT
ncbi:hypothetical protein KFL_003630080 [Klebsormidium nitens]|uniref:Uncharacterized protein n=1 Tax=Klebsormidium nitens TaxID=105231 RepID=A0A1Y1I9H3_KLENI|nr:hypothetical protein KFL_003630080 [Klebsormidium nitens]|eukprot:GAQ87590.1 hypothetical protein KFL_003630080 [Klebsormidium nitens]